MHKNALTPNMYHPLHFYPQAMHQLSRLAYHREIHFEVSRAKALSWQVLRPPPEGGVPALVQVMTQRLLQLEALELRRIDVLYSIMAGAAAAAGGDFFE